jgi:hypothetical protein
MLSLLIDFHIYKIRKKFIIKKNFSFRLFTIEVELMYNHMIDNLLMEHSFHNELLVVAVVELIDIVLED